MAESCLKVSFGRDGGTYKLADRDWTAYPPTQTEIEALFTRCMLLEKLLAPVLHHFIAGNIQTADELPNAKFEEVIHWIAAVRSIMGPPRPVRADEMHMASLGLAE